MVPFVFIDRDDTLIYDVPYLSDPARVQLTPGAPDALRRLWSNGFKIALVTNQSGVGRGLFTIEQLAHVQLRLMEILAEQGCGLDAVYICPHAPDQHCNCRKPATGMLEQACREHDIDLSQSVFVGDGAGDIACGKAFGIKTVQLRLPGKNKPEYGADFLATSLPEAAEWIVGQG